MSALPPLPRMLRALGRSWFLYRALFAIEPCQAPTSNCGVATRALPITTAQPQAWVW